MKFCVYLSFILGLILFLPTASAFDFPHTLVNIDYSGAYDTNASTACDGAEVLLGNGSCGDISAIGGDTNETIRFNALTNSDCGSGYLVIGVQSNGSVLCAADANDGGTGSGKAGDGTYLYNDSTTLYFNSTYANSNLAVNSSTYWADYNSSNSTWFQNIAGALSLKLTELVSYLDTWLGTKTTDDLTQGSTNFYDNQSFNQSLTDGLYAAIGAGADNTSWNESYATTLYAGIIEPLSLHLNQDNWYNDSNDYMYWDGDSLEFNTTKIETQYFNASTVQAIRGTPSGTVTLLNGYGSDSYNVTEVAGADGLDVRINFTGLDEVNQIIFRYKNTAGESHILKLQIWDYDDSEWENYGTASEVSDWTLFTFPIFDDSSHISAGKMQVRIYQAENGNTGHVHYFDWVTVTNGLATPSGAEVDPYAVYKDGTTPLTGNWNQGAYNFTNESSWFWGKVNWSVVQNAPAGITDTNCSEIGSCDNVLYNITGLTTDNLTQGSTNLYDNKSWNETYADTKYATIGAGADNSSWNETYASSLYLWLNGSNANTNMNIGDYIFQAIAVGTDIIAGRSSSSGLNFSENGLIKPISDNQIDLGTGEERFKNLYLGGNITASFFNGDGSLLTNLPSGNSSWNESYADTLYYGISNPYTFWNDTYATFNKTYADTLYAAAGAGNSSFNQTLTDTLYYGISNPYTYWNDTYATFNKTYADTLYAAIGAGSDNSSWNETYANTLYRLDSWDNFTGIPNAAPSSGDTTHFSLAGQIYDWVVGLLSGYNNNLNFTNGANYWNDTYATFNKTYADTLYAAIGAGADNSSWNESYADTLYSPISEPLWSSNFTAYNASWSVDTDSNLTEDDVEGYIFDDDNTANLNMSTYNITMAGDNVFASNSSCILIYGSTSTLEIC